MSADQDNFLSRWSRRKRAVAELEPVAGPSSPAIGAPPAGTTSNAEAYPASLETDLPESAPPPVSVEGEPSPVQGDAVTADELSEASTTDQETADPLDVETIDFDALDFDSDYEKFMDGGVNDETRNKALRKLWVSNPVLANMDGLDDYCEDYTDAAVCLPKGMMKTAYQFGRGFLNDEEVAEWEALGKPQDEPSETDPDIATEDDADSVVAEAETDQDASSADDASSEQSTVKVDTTSTDEQSADAVLVADETAPVGPRTA